MLIPIGHEEDEVRRWPWISIAVLVTCVLAYALASLREGRAGELAGERLSEVISYYAQHPYLELPEELTEDAKWWLDYDDGEYEYEEDYDESAESEAYEEYEKAGGYEGYRYEDEPRRLLTADEIGPTQRENEQAQLDRLTAAWQDARGHVPTYRWGLIPSRFDFGDLVASMFMHAGLWHLIGNMLFFWLSGPPLEDTWGRPVFAAFYLGAGAVAGLLWVARYPESDIPLVGASGAVAGLMGAFAVRFWSTRIRMLYFYFFLGIRTGTFTSPAWVMLGLWFVSELFWAAANDPVAGQHGGVANLAHVGGFGFGAATAGLIAYLKVEDKILRPKIDAKLGEQQNTVVEEAHALREQGRLEEAWKLLAAEAQQHPNNWDANLTLWDLALQLERPEDAQRVFLRCIRHELRTAEHELAVFHWLELTEKLPQVEVDLDFRIRMAEALVVEERGEEAAEVLADAHENLDPALPMGVRVRLARAAARARSAGAPAACRPLLDDPAVPEEIRHELRELLARAQGQGLRAAAGQGPPPVPDAAPLPLAAEAPAQRILKVIPAVPRRLTGEKIAVDVGGQARLLPLANVQAVAAVRIDGGMEPAFVVIDLLVDSLWSDKPRIRTVRLRSQEFDARTVVEGHADPHQALLSFIDNLLAISGASPLPDATSVKGRPFFSFASLPEYESKVFGFIAS